MTLRMFFCIIILFASESYIQAQEYTFPLTPQMQEWKTLPVKEKNQLLQIPNSQLHSMPTKQLISAYLNYPLCSLIFAYNTFEDGFQRVFREFNGLRELLRREDIGIHLIDYYQKLDVSDVNSEKVTQKGKFMMKFLYLELLIAQPEIINKLTDAEVMQLINILKNKYSKKMEYFSDHSILGLSYCVYSLGHILDLRFNNTKQKFNEDKDINSFLLTGHTDDYATFNKIINEAESISKR